MYQLVIEKAPQKALLKLDKKNQSRIIDAIDSLRTEPLKGKILVGKGKNYRSLRVWPYRVIYIILEKVTIIKVITIAHRQGVYKNI